MNAIQHLINELRESHTRGRVTDMEIVAAERELDALTLMSAAGFEMGKRVVEKMETDPATLLTQAIDKLIAEQAIFVEHLTEKQLAEALRQAIAAGDFQRHVIIDCPPAQGVTYIPYRELEVVKAEREALRAAIREHYSQKADDRCWMDDDKLYAAAGLPPGDNRVGPKDEMLKNCARFLDQRCLGGVWQSYKELESEIVRLKAELSYWVKVYGPKPESTESQSQS